MSTPATIRLEDDPAPALRAAAARLDLHDDADLVLGLVDDILELRTLDARRGTGVRVDFRPVDLRTGAGNLSTKQPLARAVGPRGRRVLDATAGLGGDAFLIACLGHHVVATERHPVVAALLADGVRRALADPHLAAALGGRLEVRHADARAVLAIETFDVVYIDPMFPPKRKTSALPRKEIVMLRRLVGDDPDAAALLACARAAGARVVVKRADDAPALGDGVVAAHRGKTVRYDVHR